jgi:CYTH domain-containing protein
MAIEIERKFLVNHALWEQYPKGQGTLYQQGYLLISPAKTVRIRLAGEVGFITIKGQTHGTSRLEYEYPIPGSDAAEMIGHFCAGTVCKVRHHVPYQGHTWEVDVFEGENQGLIVAEIELQHEAETFSKPPWVLQEVTDDPRYFNAYLSEYPFQTW